MALHIKIFKFRKFTENISIKREAARLAGEMYCISYDYEAN